MQNGNKKSSKNKKADSICKKKKTKDEVQEENFILRISHDPDLLYVRWE